MRHIPEHCYCGDYHTDGELVSNFKPVIVVWRCADCWQAEEPCIGCERKRLDLMVEAAHTDASDCGREDCQKCCQHSDTRDHGICLDCGHEKDY